VKKQISEISSFTTKIEMYSTMGLMVSGIAVGFMYENFGRRKTMSIFMILLGCIVVYFPFSLTNLSYMMFLIVALEVVTGSLM